VRPRQLPQQYYSKKPDHIHPADMMILHPNMSKETPVTVAHGDGIGPETMDTSLHIIPEAGAQPEIETNDAGGKVYLSGNTAGMEPSLNVTTRKRLGLHADIRPRVAYAPCVDTKHPGMDVVIVRENEGDLYAGIEYQLSPDIMQSIKLICGPAAKRWSGLPLSTPGRTFAGRLPASPKTTS